MPVDHPATYRSAQPRTGDESAEEDIPTAEHRRASGPGSGLRAVVTGCGRSGTAYMSEVLDAAGLSCGHEHVFTVMGPQAGSGLDAESSWYAAPYLDRTAPETRVLHLVRNPRHVVRSFFRIGLCAVDPWHHFTFGRPPVLVALKYNVRWARYRRRWRFVMAHRRLLRDYTRCFCEHDEIDRLWRYWREWNVLVEEGAAVGKRPYMRVCLEDLDESLPAVGRFLGLPEDTLRPRRPVNKKGGYRMRSLEWTPMPDEVRSLARRYGYDDNELGGERLEARAPT